MAEDRRLDNFEKAAQEYFKETWEFCWTLIGSVTLFAMTLFGIYFSQVAISDVIGAVGIMLYFSWAAATSISALEVAGIKLLGNNERSRAILVSNRGEFTISKWFTYLLFVFDIFTNWRGLYLTAVSVMSSVTVGVVAETLTKTKLSLGAWVVIICFGSIMAISEILVGWMIRATATSYVSFLQAKRKFDGYKANIEKRANSGSGRDTGGGDSSNRGEGYRNQNLQNQRTSFANSQTSRKDSGTQKNKPLTYDA